MKTPTHDEMVLALTRANGGKVKPFYSSLDKNAALLKRKVGTGAEFMKELQGMGGIKQAEIEDRGLGDLMNAPKMTHDEMLHELQAHQTPQIQERILKNNELDEDEVYDLANRLYHDESERGRGLSWDRRLEQAREIIHEQNNAHNLDAAQFEKYTLPGGHNYREMLLHLPIDRMHPENNFKSSHFGVQNILAHMRLKDRRGPNGEKLLHLEELQSDWHQQGREKGYHEAGGLQEELKKHNEFDKYSKELAQKYGLNPNQNLAMYATMKGMEPSEVARYEQLQNALIEAAAINKDKVPDAPFKKNWEEMALKRLIHHAAEKGYHGIVVTPGAEQADRYGLAKHIGMMSYNPEEQHFQAFKPNRETAISERGATPERVSELVGKELAQKLMSAPKQMGHHYIEGDDIKVGGEGMKGFYDKKVPNILNGIGKKYGVKTELNTHPIETEPANRLQVGEMTYGDPAKFAQVHHFPITEEMKKDVLANGLPMYRDGGIVHKAEGGDVSIHKLRNYILQHEGTYGAQRLERAFDEIPNLEDMYDEHALKRAFTGDGQNTNLLARINPADFEKYAVGLNSRTHREPSPSLEDKKKKREVSKYDMSTDDYLKYLASIGKLSDVPYLQMYQDETGIPLIPHITGHEGRHRNRALAMKGQSKNLIQIHMKGALREDFPRRDREEYINALQKQLASSHNLVYPEHRGEDDEPRRPAIKLPDIYAEGGKVSLLRKHGLPTSSIEDAQRKLGEGHLVFVAHEQDEHPREVRSVSEFHGYVPDQIYTVHPKHFAKGGSIWNSPDWKPHSENDLLQPIGASRMVGDEKLLSQDNTFSLGLSEFPSNKKSYRYLYHGEDKNPIGSMQIQTSGPRSKKAVIQNLYVAEANRRQGIASKLLDRARQDFDVKHSNDLTTAGKAFAKAKKAKGGIIHKAGGGNVQPLIASPKQPSVEQMQKELASKEDALRLYHGSPEENLSQVQDKGLFGGVFGHANKDVALSHGDHIYHSDIPESKILTNDDLNYDLPYKKVSKALNNNLLSLARNKDLREKAWEAIVEDKGVYHLDEDDVQKIFGTSDLGEAAWEAQKVRGAIAKDLGYQAVQMKDEHGTSYLILPGAKLHNSSKEIEKYAEGGITHKAEGGTMNPTPSMAEMRLALLRSNPIAIQSYGANEAPGMNPKAYIPPDLQERNNFVPPPGGAALPTGGVDTNPTQSGQQLMPQQQGIPPSPTEAAGQAAPQGLQGASSPLQQPPSNILQMTPQGRALGAMTPPKAPMSQMAAGGRQKSVAEMKDELALPVEQKAAREPSIGMLKGAFDKAIAHHESLPLQERANNGKQARQTIEGYIGKGTKLLAGNIKLQKAAGDVEGYEPITLPDGRGVVTTGLSLSPAHEEGKFNTCPNSKSCAKQCLGKTANGNYIYGGGADLEAMLGPRLAHYKKTQALLRDPEAFATRLHDEITARKIKAAEENNMLAIRLNVLSDLHPKVYESLIRAHPDVMFYDYTKNNTRPVAPNHHLTYSSTGVSQPKTKTGLDQDIENPHQNWKLVRGHLDNGRNVAMAFSHRDALPDHIHDEESGKTYKVVDGDTHDFRPLDTQEEGNNGVIIGLRKKSMLHANHNAAMNSDGFFTHYDPKFQKLKGKIVRDAEGNPVRTNTVVSIAKQKSGLITLNNDGKKE